MCIYIYNLKNIKLFKIFMMAFAVAVFYFLVQSSFCSFLQVNISLQKKTHSRQLRSNQIYPYF